MSAAAICILAFWVLVGAWFAVEIRRAPLVEDEK